MNRVRAFVFTAFSMLSGTSWGVMAQPIGVHDVITALEGTLSVTAIPRISSGRLTGCTLVFEHLQRDDLYLNGNFLKVSGSLGIIGDGENLAFIMKALAHEFAPDTLSTRAIDLNRVYLFASEYVSNFDSLIDAYSADIDGGVLAIFHFEPSAEMLIEAFFTGSARVAVGPSSGTSDILVKLDLTVVDTDASGERTRSDSTMVSFFECSDRLLSQFLQ